MHELETWVNRMTYLWNERFDALDRVLPAEKKKTLKKQKGRPRNGNGHG
jgi:hypothetical protein